MRQETDMANSELHLSAEDWLRRRATVVTYPIARWLAQRKLHPNTVTIVGFLLTCVAAAIIAPGHLRWGGLMMLLASSTDALDGTLARMTSQQSRFGAFLDSTLDRLSEGAVLVSMLVWFLHQDSDVGVILVALALLGSVMISYTRARAEGVGYACKVGMLTRPARVVILAFGLLSLWLVPTLAVLTVLIWFTVLQRMVHVYRVSRRDP